MNCVNLVKNIGRTRVSHIRGNYLHRGMLTDHAAAGQLLQLQHKVRNNQKRYPLFYAIRDLARNDIIVRMTTSWAG